MLAAGFFDGVHLGHRAVLDGAVARARELGGQAWALTFDKHPKAVLEPGAAPPLLTPGAMRLELLGAAGLDGACLLDFRPETAAQSPAAFVRGLCAAGSVAEIHCGANWRFGFRAEGTPGRLAALGEKEGFRVVVEDDVFHNGAPVSSTRIRKAVAEGDLEGATAMLGRPHAARGVVVRGRGVAHTFGFATANIRTAAAVLPPVGVYAVRARAGDRTLLGAGSLGWRPTFGDERPAKPALEVHFLGFEGDLYGATLDVAFCARIRDERRFASPDALFAQIREDANAAGKYFRETAGG